MPEVRPYSRGSKAAALELARCPVRLAAAVQDLEADYYAKSSKGPRESKLKTLLELAEACQVELFPLNILALQKVAACLKGAL